MVYMSTDARKFLNEIADILRAKGREVTIEETTESFGTFAWLSAPAPHWYDRTINLSATLSDRTNRWSLGTMNIGGGANCERLTKTTRSSMKIAADVYA